MALDEVVGEGLGEVLPPEIRDLMSGVGGIRRQQDTQMGVMFLALVNKPDVEIGPNGENTRRDGAKAAFGTWKSEAEARLKSLGVAAPTRDQIHENMIAEIQQELQSLNGGRPLNAKGAKEINDLFALDDAQFLEKIMANAEKGNQAFDAHVQAVNAAKAQGKPIPLYEHVGIMEALMHSGDGEGRPRLDGVSLTGVDVSPQGQTEAKIDGAFDDVVRLMGRGNNSEQTLAHLACVATGDRRGEMRLEDGSYDPDSHSFANVNKFEGPGALAPGAYQEWLSRFNSDEGLGSNYSLLRGGEEAPANMDNLVTEAMVGRGIVTFDSQAARVDWNTHMGGLLAGEYGDDHRLHKISGADLRESMETFARARSDIKFANESDADNALGVNAAEIRQEASGAPVVEAAAAPVENAAVADPVSAAGAVAYLAAESGVGPLVSATPEATMARLSSVPEFLADMRAQQQLNAVPSYSPLAQMQIEPQLMEPNMGPRIGN